MADRQILTESTKTTIGVSIACCTVMASGAWWLSTSFGQLSTSIRDTATQLRMEEAAQNAVLTSRIEGLSYDIRDLNKALMDRWTKSQHVEWSLKFAKLNSDLHLKLPEEQ
jgi:hypothetical protein